ncbi:MAG: GPI transamidase component [Alyxoria varia]|nr:MAG: GPI transamidase component [Alyxoria varia]
MSGAAASTEPGGRDDFGSNPVPPAQSSNAFTAASSGPKAPPPESPESASTRRWTIFSFWLIVLTLGLPFWWKTTTVHRAALPLDSMNRWAEGQGCRPHLPLQVLIHAHSLHKDAAQRLLQQTQAVVDDLNDVPQHQLILSLAEDENPDYTAALNVKVMPVKGSNNAEAVLQSGILNVSYNPKSLPSQFSPSTPFILFLARHISGTFAEERAIVAQSLPDSGISLNTDNGTGAVLHNFMPELERRKTRSMKYSSVYHLTFTLITPEATPTDWEVEKALADAIEPLVDGLSLLYDFTIDTQVQPYSTWSASVSPVYSDEKKAWILRRSDLRGFINAAEWPLSPSIRPGPTINFLLYIPSKAQSPLLVEDYESNSWLIPQWGSVVIYNPPSWKALDKSKVLNVQELLDPFWIFSQNLVLLLGLPASEQPTYLRILSQIRLLSLYLISSASGTLGSTARLTQTLPSISIPENVAGAVDGTIEQLNTACIALKNGQFQGALDNAKIAEARSDKAFFDKSMVGQVYFPEEHKVAVYLPLLGPVAVPLIMTAVKELKSYVRQSRSL